MKTFKIYVTEPGEARKVNPFSPYDPKHEPGTDYSRYDWFSKNHPITPAYTPTGELLGVGEWDAVEVWQYNSADVNHPNIEWVDIPCGERDYYDGFPTRRIYRAVIPQTTTTEEKAQSTAGEDVEAAAFNEATKNPNLTNTGVINFCNGAKFGAHHVYRNQPVSIPTYTKDQVIKLVRARLIEVYGRLEGTGYTTIGIINDSLPTPPTN